VKQQGSRICWYGGAGVRSVEQLRLVMAELQVATVRAQVQLSLFTDFENFSVFKPAPYQEKSVNTCWIRLFRGKCPEDSSDMTKKEAKMK
jgi:hypothetical protein